MSRRRVAASFASSIGRGADAARVADHFYIGQDGISPARVDDTHLPIGAHVPSEDFPSLEAAFERLTAQCRQPDGSWHCDSGSSHGRDWTWGYSVPDFIELVNVGWHRGAAEAGDASGIADRFIAATDTDSTMRDVCGAFVDVAAFVSGEPECMIEFTSESTPDRRVNLVIDMFVSCGNNARLIFERGRVVMGALLALQAAGVAVSLDAAMRTNGTGGPLELRIPLHRPGQVLDAARLIAVIAHPASVRSFFFELARLNGADWCIPNNRVRPRVGELMVPGLEGYAHDWMNPAHNDRFIKSLFAAAEGKQAA